MTSRAVVYREGTCPNGIWARASVHTFEDFVAEGDKVVLRWSVQCTHQGEFLGVPATGKAVRITGTVTWLVKDGKLHEEWPHWDALGVLRQLGRERTPSTLISFWSSCGRMEPGIHCEDDFSVAYEADHRHHDSTARADVVAWHGPPSRDDGHLTVFDVPLIENGVYMRG